MVDFSRHIRRELGENMTEETTEETTPVSYEETSSEDFWKAGLVDEGIYRFEVLKADVRKYPISAERREKDANGHPIGPTHFRKLVVRTQLLEDSLGVYEAGRSTDIITESIPLYGKSLRRLAKFYQALTNSTPVVRIEEGTGKELIDYDAMAASMGGCIAWGAVVHKNRQKKNPDTNQYENTDEIDSKYAWSFAQSPDQVRAPQELQKKLAEIQQKLESGDTEVVEDEVPF
jgi:hypothetical protein